MATTLDKIRAAIAEHEEKLEELRAAEKVVMAIDNEPQGASANSWTSINPETRVTTTHQVQPKSADVTIGSLVMSALDDGPHNLGVILERVRATGKDVADQSISSALQVLKRKNLVIRKGRMWRAR